MAKSGSTEGTVESLQLAARYGFSPKELSLILAAVELPEGYSLILETYGHTQQRAVGLMTLAGGGALAALIGLLALLGAQSINTPNSLAAASAARLDSAQMSPLTVIAMISLVALMAALAWVAWVWHSQAEIATSKMLGSIQLMQRLAPRRSRVAKD